MVAVGRVKPPFAEAESHYRRLLARHSPVELVEVKDEREIVPRLPGRAHVVALDREGRAMDSRSWSRWLDERRLEARDVCFLVGGPRGLSAGTLSAAAERISLGPQTMAHQLARVVLLEQLFRAAKILAGETYHY